MNWNPYKRPDWKKLTDAELDAASKSISTKQKIFLGLNVAAIVIAGVALGAIFWPTVLPAIPVYISNFMVCGCIFSQNRFSRLKRECISETLDRSLNALTQQMANLKTPPAPTPEPAPKPAPAKPVFNHEAATVLDGDLEVNKPLKFKSKAQPVTTA